MPLAIQARNPFSVFQSSYNADGAQSVSLPDVFNLVLPEPEYTAENPVYLLKIRPTAGTAASLPGAVVGASTGFSLDSLTIQPESIQNTRKLGSNSNFTNLDNILGAHLVVRALPYTTAEINAAAPSPPGQTRDISGVFTIEDTGAEVHTMWSFGLDAAGTTAVYSAFCPKGLAGKAVGQTNSEFRLDLAEFDINTEIDLLLVCKG